MQSRSAQNRLKWCRATARVRLLHRGEALVRWRNFAKVCDTERPGKKAKRVWECVDVLRRQDKPITLGISRSGVPLDCKSAAEKLAAHFNEMNDSVEDDRRGKRNLGFLKTDRVTQ